MELNKVYLPLFERYGSLTEAAEFRQGMNLSKILQKRSGKDNV